MDSTPDSACEETIRVLLEALNDKDDSVNSSIVKSLNKIAAVHPNSVVTVFCDLYNTHQFNDRHLSFVVKMLEQTCVNGVKNLRHSTAEELTQCMLSCMTRSNDYLPSVQLGASAVLVAVGHVHLDTVLRSLMREISCATLPHYTVPHTLGTLAAVNTRDIVAHIKNMLSNMIPQLSLIKTDTVKQAYSYAFGHFAVAVSEQIGDNVENDNFKNIKENFVAEFSVIFDVLFNQWLHSHDARVTESVLEALGPISRLISEQKFNETVNKFVTTLLNMYKKASVNQYMISQSISYLLSSSPLNPKLSLTDHVLSSVLYTLFQLVLLEPDYDQPQTLKNHFEVLRCYDHMADQYAEMTIENLMNQCRSNQEKERIKAVIVLTHLTTSSQIFIDKYSAKFIAVLKVMIANEQNMKMKKVLVKAIVGLVYRNCIAKDDDFAMIQFIIKHSSSDDLLGAPSDAEDLRDTCESSLFLLSNTVTNVKSQLLNLFLKCLLIDDFVGSATTLTQCLTNLLKSLKPEDKISDYKMDFGCNIFVRCLIFLIDPTSSQRNRNILIFLESYSDNIHSNLNLTSNVEAQRLLKYVDKNESEDQWHSMLRDLLVSTVDLVNNNKWLETVSMVLSQQISSTKMNARTKGLSLQFLAILCCHMTNTTAVRKLLDVIIHSVRTTPLEGCHYVAKAVGIASRKNGDYALSELDLIYRDVDSKRGSKFFNFMSKSSKTESETYIGKIVTITCYGYVATESMDEHVLASFGEHVTSTINDVLKTSPVLDLARAALTSLYEIARALYPAPHHSVVLRSRWQLLNVVLEQLFNRNLENRNVELYPIIVKAATALTKLQKGMLPEERNTILRLLFSSIFGELSSLKMLEKSSNETRYDFLAKTLNDSLNFLHSLVKELVMQSTCLSMIDDMVSLLYDWLHHDNENVRAATNIVLNVVLDTYIKNVKLNYETPSKFGQMGYLLGVMVPKTTDANFAVRLSAMDNIKLIVQIEDLYDGHAIEPDDPCFSRLSSIHNSVLTNDLKMITEYSSKLADTLSEKIPQLQLQQFVESILERFEDDECSSTGISAVLNEVLKRKGADLYQSIERTVEVLLATMERVESDRRFRLLTPLASLAHHHANAVTAVLLCQPLPLKPCVVACWRHMARDCVLSVAVVENFVRTMTSIQLFEDPYHVTENRIAALQPLTMISALGSMLEEAAMRQLCADKFAELFAVLYTTVACYASALPPAYTVPPTARQRYAIVPNRDAVYLSPPAIALHTFGSFLHRVGCEKIKEACVVYTGASGAGEAPELAPVLAGALCRELAPHLPRAVAALAPYAHSALPPHRRAVAALYTELLYYRCNDNPVVMESVLARLSSGCGDSAASVRVAALRGLAGAARLPPVYRDKHLPQALAALAQATDQVPQQGPVSESVPLAAMQGLCRLLSDADVVKTEHQREVCCVAQKIRPFFNTDEPALREHAVKLFGVIAAKVSSPAMRELSTTLLPCFMLRLCDDDHAVVRASKQTLKHVLGTVGCPNAHEFARAHLLESGRLAEEVFLAALVRMVAREAPSTVPQHIQNALPYLNSAQDNIRAHAATLIGVLYQETSGRAEVEEEVRGAARSLLVQLLRAPGAKLRRHAALALSSVCLAANTQPSEHAHRHEQTSQRCDEASDDGKATDDEKTSDGDVYPHNGAAESTRETELAGEGKIGVDDEASPREEVLSSVAEDRQSDDDDNAVEKAVQPTGTDGGRSDEDDDDAEDVCLKSDGNEPTKNGI